MYRVVFACALLLAGCDLMKDRGVSRGAYSHLPEVERIQECVSPCPRIVLDSVGIVGSPSDPALPLQASYLAASGGLISASLTSVPGEPPLYDSKSGEFLKTIGKWGGGPGEFIQPYPFPGLNDRLWLFDPGNTRISVLSDSGNVERSFRFHASPYSLVPLDSSRFAISGISEKGARLSIHVYASNGEHVVSFGPRFGKDYHGYPKIDVAPDGTIWLAHANMYRLEQWSPHGRLLRVLDRDVDWFEPWHSARWDRDATINWMQVDRATGELWIGIAVPDPHSPPPAYWEGRQITVSVKDSMRDMRIEVIDPRRTAVVASTRFDLAKIISVPPTRRVSWSTQNEDGYISYVLADRRIERR